MVDAALQAAAVCATDKILEIGPGTGILTSALVASGAEILAVEKVGPFPARHSPHLPARPSRRHSPHPLPPHTPPQDHVLAEKLLQTFAGVPRLRLVEDDVLRWLKRDPEAQKEFPAAGPDGERAKARRRSRGGIVAPLRALRVGRRASNGWGCKRTSDG